MLSLNKSGGMTQIRANHEPLFAGTTGAMTDHFEAARHARGHAPATVHCLLEANLRAGPETDGMIISGHIVTYLDVDAVHIDAGRTIDADAR